MLAWQICVFIFSFSCKSHAQSEVKETMKIVHVQPITGFRAVNITSGVDKPTTLIVVDESRGTDTSMSTVNSSNMSHITRAIWRSKKKRKDGKTTDELETTFLKQYNYAVLDTDLTKLDNKKLKEVCRIASKRQTYPNLRNPYFVTKTLKFSTDKKRSMIVNLLYCPNMRKYIRESATNPNQCIYIYKRPLYRTKLRLEDEKCVNLQTEVNKDNTRDQRHYNMETLH